MILGKAAALEACIADGTNFEYLKDEDFDARLARTRNTLMRNGYAPTGEETFFDGRTGEMIKCQIFTGPYYIQELYHKAEDKMQGRARGLKNLLTFQGEKGRQKGAAVKFGELEQFVASAHGASFFLEERMSKLSDKIEVIYCTNCKNNISRITTTCEYCGFSGTFVKIDISGTFKYLSQILAGMNINLQVQATDLEQHFKNIEQSEAEQKEDLSVYGIEEEQEEEERKEEEEIEDALDCFQDDPVKYY
jgi:DNA-directed RNA polymerase beta subunit